MAGWLIVSLTKYSISDTDPHKRTDREEFFPSEAGFPGDCPETRLGVGMGVRMGARGSLLKQFASFPQCFLSSVFVTT